MYKKILVVLFFLLIALVGIDSPIDMEEQDFVLALGVEACGSGYLFNYSIADLSNTATSEDVGTKVPSTSKMIFADSFAHANGIWESKVGKPLHFGHLKFVVFANNHRDKKIENEMKRNTQIAKSVYFLESKRNLKTIFSTEEKLGQSLGESVIDKIEAK